VSLISFDGSNTELFKIALLTKLLLIALLGTHKYGPLLTIMLDSFRGFHTGEPSICAMLLDENVNGFPLACVSFAADPLALLLELRLEFDEHELFVS
jgi:hypothetical protein